MKVLQVYPYYPPAWEFGGALRVVHRLATRLADRGHDVTVYTTDARGNGERIDEPAHAGTDGPGVEYFPNVSTRVASSLHFPVPLGFRRALKTSVSRFDVVHVHGFPHLMAVGAVRAASAQGVPCVVTPHGAVNQPNEEEPPLLRRLFVAAFGGTILSGASVVTALTADEQRRLESTGVDAGSIVRIPNGVDATELADGDGTEFRRRHGFDGQHLVGFVGRLHPKKGLDVVVECAARFRDDPDVSFVVIGPDDGYETELRRRIRERDLGNVSVLGYVSEEEKRDALHAMDVFLHPSYAEGQPMAVLEACATGTPVVISERCALPEIDRFDAGIVTAAEPDATASALDRLLSDRRLRSEMGSNGRRLIDEEFTWDRVVGRYEDLFGSLSEGER